MNELIDALQCTRHFALYQDCYEKNCYANSGKGLYCNIPKLMADAADALEAVDKRIAELEAQLPKEGEWINEDLDNFRKYKVTCPHCGAWYIGNYDAYDEPSDFNYCPHCGNICNQANLAWEKELSERERKEQTDADN